MTTSTAGGARGATGAGDGAPGPAVTVGALRRGLEILDMFSRDRRVVGIGEIANELSIHKSSASRLAATLALSGYLTVEGVQGTYRLGPRIAALGPLAASRQDLSEIVLPHLAALTEVTGETGHLAVLDGSDTKTLAVTDGWHTVRMHSWVGKQSPAYCSSMGKALLAGLDDADVRELYPTGTLPTRTPHTLSSVDELVDDLHGLRRNGYGLDDEELELDLRCISAPVFSADGVADASISISGPAQRVSTERVPALQEQVRWYAWQASVARGARAVPAGWAPPPVDHPAPPAWILHH